jgi:biopolymer transport protein ExbD
MKKYSKSHHSTMNEINITPLMDLVFVLLVIFIISTAPMVNDLDLNLPSKQKPQNQPPVQKKPNFLIVEADGKVFLNGKNYSFQSLLTELTRMHNEDTNTAVIVHGDSKVLYQNMVSVMDVLQQADVTKVGLATDRPSAAPASQM